MITYTGWERDYEQNKEHYTEIFNGAMLQNHIEDTEWFERKISNLIGRKYVVAVNNATDALYFSLLANGIGEGDEVLVTDFSWISTSSCISMVGATPVFCDVDIDSYHMSLDSIKRMYSPKTKAIIYTHLFGNMTDTTAILEFCKENNIVFIEDAAQALGSSLNGIKAGSIGDCSSFSFNTNKVVAGISGGGVFLTDDENQANYVKKIRRHGNFETLGYNSKTSMMLLNAEIIDYRMSRMQEHMIRRQEIAKQYDEVFEDLGLNIQVIHDGLDHNYHKYVLRFADKETRKHVKNELQRNNIQASIHYERPLSENILYHDIEYRKDDCKNTKEITDTILSLPIHAWLTDDEVEKVTNVVWANG